jgi:hypothetical protein
VETQLSHFTDWDIAVPLEWRTVPIILLNCWQMAAHYSLIPYHVPRSVWTRSSMFFFLVKLLHLTENTVFPPNSFHGIKSSLGCKQ